MINDNEYFVSYLYYKSVKFSSRFSIVWFGIYRCSRYHICSRCTQCTLIESYILLYTSTHTLFGIYANKIAHISSFFFSIAILSGRVPLWSLQCGRASFSSNFTTTPETDEHVMWLY